MAKNPPKGPGRRGAVTQRSQFLAPSGLWAKLEAGQREIYRHRSKALHEGIPFPSPMCSTPRGMSSVGLDEAPLGDWGTYDASWSGQTLPMYLHTYAYLVGEALRAWWRALGNP
jgi:hypothetical protein